MPGKRFSLKDHLFNEEKVSYLADLLAGAVDGFDPTSFRMAVMAEMPALELKQRIDLIARIMGDHLDPRFEVAATQIEAALPPPLDPALGDDDFGDFILAPFGRYVEVHGTDHYATSMNLLKETTKRFSMESSIRPFIDLRPAETLRSFDAWAHDDNYHVRRLVSEATRPTLPWSPRISLEVDEPIPLLDILHADSTRYVTRSVANHLNDISKIEPRLAIDALTRWRRAGSQSPTELGWMTNHALRTLVKKGDADAMAFLGFSPDPQVETGPVELATPVVRAGESLEFAVPIVSRRSERLIVDYIIDFVRKNGETGRKVFKLKRLSLETGDKVTLSKSHRLRADATTYSLHSGIHRISVVVNGNVMASTEFDVIV